MKTRLKHILKTLALPLTMALGAGAAHAANPPAPTVLKIGTLYASSGPFAVASEGEYHGLLYWADGINKDGGVFVKAYNKKIPVKVVAYDDQSSTSTATSLYNQLITQDHVDLLVSDFGSVLTSVAIPLAAEHHMLLIDPTGSGASFFTQKTNYLANVSIPASSVWPLSLGHFLLDQKIQRIAILYDSNDLDASQAATLKATLEKNGVEPVYYHGVPTSESNYTILLHTIAAHSPDAVIEFGYPPNDIAFLRTLATSGMHFKMTFTIFPGQLLEMMSKTVGAKAMAYTYTYPTPPLVSYDDTNLGPNTADFVSQFQAATHTDPNFLNAAGYNAGLIMQQMLAIAPTFDQLAFHQALMDMSGKTKTIIGDFKINENGAQIGELFPVAQLVPSDNGLKVTVVYPQDKATAKPIYPAPQQ